MQNYELYIIFDQQTSAEQCDAILQSLLSELHAENISITREGVKKFRYPIRKQWAGQYYLVTCDISLDYTSNINSTLKTLNRLDEVMRYVLVNQTEYLIQKSKEKLNPEPEFTDHKEYNKGKVNQKRCIMKYLGYRVIDYKNVELLEQFMSPYAKIFSKSRTGVSSKYQRKISQAIERARHMGLLPYTDKWIQ